MLCAKTLIFYNFLECQEVVLWRIFLDIEPVSPNQVKIVVVSFFIQEEDTDEKLERAEAFGDQIKQMFHGVQAASPPRFNENDFPKEKQDKYKVGGWEGMKGEGDLMFDSDSDSDVSFVSLDEEDKNDPLLICLNPSSGEEDMGVEEEEVEDFDDEEEGDGEEDQEAEYGQGNYYWTQSVFIIYFNCLWVNNGS